VDEKSLKGAEIFNRKVRRDPITGEVPSIITDSDFRNTYTIIGLCGVDTGEVPLIITDSDFRNTYTIIGLCGVDTSTPPFFFNLNQFTNDSEAFSIAVEEAIIAGFLKSGDILVMDNAAIHVFGENDVLVDFLWENFGIHMLMLPTCSPELNPIELLWQILVQRLKSINLDPSRYMQHRVAYQAANIMNGFTHFDLAKCYQHCGYVV
jgi:uncharacterized membrane protein YuzA (DUF378 family)